MDPLSFISYTYTPFTPYLIFPLKLNHRKLSKLCNKNTKTEHKPTNPPSIPAGDSLSDHLSSVTDDSQNPNFLTDNLIMERGSRYKAYADLRESNLRTKLLKNSPPLSPENQHSINNPTPLKKQVKLQGDTIPNRRKGSSVSTESVRDFSSTLRKENRKPVLPPAVEKSATPPVKSGSRLYVVNGRSGGSRSSAPVEKRRGGLLTAIRSSRRAVQTWMN